MTGDCYNDDVMESNLKVEPPTGERFVTRVEAKQHVLDYIEVYYNRKRLSSKWAKAFQF